MLARLSAPHLVASAVSWLRTRPWELSSVLSPARPDTFGLEQIYADWDPSYMYFTDTDWWWLVECLMEIVCCVWMFGACGGLAGQECEIIF